MLIYELTKIREGEEVNKYYNTKRPGLTAIIPMLLNWQVEGGVKRSH